MTPWAWLTSACGNAWAMPCLVASAMICFGMVRALVISGGAGVPSNAPNPAATATPAPASATRAPATPSMGLQERRRRTASRTWGSSSMGHRVRRREASDQIVGHLVTSFGWGL